MASVSAKGIRFKITISLLRSKAAHPPELLCMLKTQSMPRCMALSRPLV